MGSEAEAIAFRGVMCAEAVAYDRLAATDAEAAAGTLRASRDIVHTRARAFGGDLIDHPGDEFVAFFPQPVQALSCALDVQAALEQRNAELPTEHRMFFRIGVGVGHPEEVDTLGIEIAQRVRSLADPGGTCVSGHAFDQIDGRLPLAFEDLGLQAVRCLPRPVRVYRTVPQPIADDPA